MKKIIAIVCMLFAAVMVMALPASAATPYQTYTYSINGTALYSPDAYTPSRTVDAKYMGLENENMLCKYHTDLAALREKLNKAEKDLAAVKSGSSEYENLKKIRDNALKAYQDRYNVLKGIGNQTSDLEVDANNNVYLVDTANNRVIVLDRYYKVKFIISDFLNRQGIIDGFSSPKGVYITADDELRGREGKIYVCDTDAARIVTFDLDGNFLDIIAEPQSELFDTGSQYRPIAVAVDAYNRLYVVGRETYQGIIVMTEDGEFTGFVGAQQVVISTWDKLWRMIRTDAQKSNDEANISQPFNNITLSGDFIYVTIDLSKSYASQQIASLKDKTGTYSPVKMLNASGDEIMRRNGFFGPAGEVDNVKLNNDQTVHGASVVLDVAVGPEKTWSIIDNKRSKVFTYDFDGNLLFAFGDMGDQLGNISKEGLNAITYQGDTMLLLDRFDASFTVYNRTEYGDVLMRALKNQNDRKNDEAISDWEEILKRNANFDAAYIGIGKAYANENKFEDAIKEYKAAYDTTNYSISYKELRKNWLSKYILLIPVVVIAVAILVSKFLGFAAKYNKRISTTKGKRTYIQELMFVFHVIFHPFDGFWDLKHEKRGSLRGGLTILLVTLIAFYYQSIGQGYILNPTQSYSSVITVILSVLVPLALWVVANWCLTTLFEGEGSLKDIFIATTYSLAPLAIFIIPVTAASHFVVESEVAILTLFTSIAYIWAGILIFFGTMITHDYTMGKNVITTLGTIVGMVCIMFIAILFSTLLGKMVGFVSNIVTEIQYRM